jgi:hypothetical protein
VLMTVQAEAVESPRVVVQGLSNCLSIGMPNETRQLTQDGRTRHG